MHYQRNEEYYQYDYSDRCFHKKWRVIAFKNRMDNIEFLLDYKIIFRFQATKHIEISFLKYEVNFVEKFENFFFFLFRINTCRNLTSNLRSWSDKRQTKAVICNRKLIKIDTDA